MPTPLQMKILNDPRAQADVLKQIEHAAASRQSDDFDGDVGPWMDTPLGPKAKAAWERGMRRRAEGDRIMGRYTEKRNSVFKHDPANLNDKSEWSDSRDIFERAMEK